MKILDAIRGRRSRHSGLGTEAEGGSPGGSELPIADYDRLKDKEITAHLPQLSQVELAAVESYERAHDSRPVVLDKLRYMRGGQPLPGYDALTTEQVAETLAGASSQTVKAVRDYERKFRRRQSVLDETARLLPSATASAGEQRARGEKAALLREGYADRQRIASDLPE